jgi:hypothetical protein
MFHNLNHSIIIFNIQESKQSKKKLNKLLKFCFINFEKFAIKSNLFVIFAQLVFKYKSQ